MKLLITEKKGATIRARDLETNKEIRIFERDFKDIDFLIGTLFDCEAEVSGNLLVGIKINKEILGDCSKERIEVDTAAFNVGDLINGVPILKMGKKYAKNGKKMAYAYFK